MKLGIALWVLTVPLIVANWNRDETQFKAGQMSVLRDCALEGQVILNERVYNCLFSPLGAAVPEQPKKPTVNPSEI